eukprot:CAMPEP_0172760742 /NCGR_PEP_ID=MMETSP1074-20121228/170217_1 /TAXON_ID=2916 /ORGANISM="Ceratium fusus, Strain PA161109" /LENGTH=117 /DNA_ID=CAMNT_0013594795 /DNA_START=549 /DNA_END=902 /DNA_ORIENTATION=+
MSETYVANWRKLWWLRQAGCQFKLEDNGKDDGWHMARFEMVARIFTSALVNRGARTFLQLSMPLFLMASESHIEFLKDVVAVIFITELDDSPGSFYVTLDPKDDNFSETETSELEQD